MAKVDARLFLPKNLENNELSLIERWLNGKAPGTIQNYLFELRGFFLWYERILLDTGAAKPSVENLTANIFNLYINEFLVCRSKAKRGRVRSALGSFFRFLTETGMIKKNPFECIPTIKLESKIFDRYLSPEQIDKMITLETNPRDQLILKCLYQGAFRVSELVNIQWKDLSVSEREQAVYVSVLGKGSKYRTVMLFGSVVSDLAEFRKQNESKSEYVFFSREEGSGHLHKTRVNGMVKRAALLAGIEKKVSPHWFRHAHATHAIEKGAPLHLVRDTLGHSSIKTTSIYLDANPEESSGNYLMEF